MIAVASVGFGVSVREYHIPYVENRDDVKVKYVFRKEQDIAQCQDDEPFYEDAEIVKVLETSETATEVA